MVSFNRVIKKMSFHHLETKSFKSKYWGGVLGNENYWELSLESSLSRQVFKDRQAGQGDGIQNMCHCQARLLEGPIRRSLLVATKEVMTA